MEEPTAADDGEFGDIEKFWELAKFHARLNPIPSYFGPTTLETLTPPAFTLGGDGLSDDEALRQLIDDNQLQLTTPRSAYEDDGDLPTVGSLGIVLDGAGHPRALVETSDVRIQDDVAQVIEDLRVVWAE